MGGVPEIFLVCVPRNVILCKLYITGALCMLLFTSVDIMQVNIFLTYRVRNRAKQKSDLLYLYMYSLLSGRKNH